MAEWQATVLTLFPEAFPGVLGLSLSGRALADGRWTLSALDIRDHATDRHRTVDDAPFGGGAGMVMKPDVIDAAIADARARPGHEALPLVYLTPRGRRLDQQAVQRLAAGPGVIALCGRYEGVDQRVIDANQAEEISIGDYVLSGGEIAAQVLIDACVRLLPGVLGNAASSTEESFEAGLLEYPQFTRPALWRDRAGRDHPVPEVLLGGNHAAIAAWRRASAERLTRDRRPDLLAAASAVRSHPESNAAN